MAREDTQTAADGQNKPGLINQLRANPRLPLAIGAALAITLLVGAMLWSSEPTYGVLYSGLADADGGEIIAQLEQMQVPYEFAAGGSTIRVPMNQIDRTRLSLAGQGLPKSAGIGFELMDEQSFGISQFAEHVNYNRALEGELARSIESIDSVAKARVHLAIPESTVFVRDQQAPSASVVIQLYTGRAMTEGQVEAIRHLVSSSVTRLPASAVTIVDETGALLSGEAEAAGMSADSSQLDYSGQVEQTYRERIQDILTPIVGVTNVRTQVTADIDFSNTEQTSETYGPNGDRNQAAVRSEQIDSSRSNDGDSGGGVPGALSNRPTPEEPSPINNPQDQQGNQTQRETGDGSDTGTSSHSSVVNYEVDRTIAHVQKESGHVTRLTAAVVINRTALAQGGMDNDETETTEPEAVEQRIEQIRSLVRSAIGYNEDRGDMLEIIATPFTAAVPPAEQLSPPWWKDRMMLSLIERILKYIGLAIVAWLVWRKLVKPLIDSAVRGSMRTAPGATGSVPDESMPERELTAAELEQRKKMRVKHEKMVQATNDVARNDPRVVAMIVKNWMTGNA